MSAVLAIAEPRRIKATHRRRRKIAAGHFVQRYYDPQIGRFLSVDPVAVATNSGSGFNRYGYAAQNPYRFTDPDGRKEKAKEDKDADEDGRYSIAGSSTVHKPFSEQVNCHSWAWKESKGDPGGPFNGDPNVTGPLMDQTPLDEMTAPGVTKLAADAPNRVGDRVVYGTDLNGSGGFDNEDEISHSAIVTRVDSEGNTIRVQGKEGNGPVVDHGPSGQHPTYGLQKEWYRIDE